MMKTWYGFYIESVKISDKDFFKECPNYSTLKLNGNDSFSKLKNGVYILNDYIFLKEDNNLLTEKDSILDKHYNDLNSFEKDIDSRLVFTEGSYKTKKFFGKVFEIEPDIIEEDYISYKVSLNGKYETDIVLGTDNKYSAYDGVDGYGWHDTVKKALKYYLLNVHSNEYESCSNCGDGGCLYCEPHRFL